MEEEANGASENFGGPFFLPLLRPGNEVTRGRQKETAVSWFVLDSRVTGFVVWGAKLSKK